MGYHDFEKSKLISWLFVFFQLLDVWLVTILRILPEIMRGKVLICDRGPYDTLIDVMTDTKNKTLHTSAIGKAFVKFLPASHRVLFIARAPERIFASRPDVKIDRNFNLRYELYGSCSKHFRWTVIDNNGTPEKTLGRLREELSLR